MINSRAMKMLMKRRPARGATTPTIVGEPAHRDEDGEWVEATISEEPTPIACAILPLDTKIIESSAGYYTTKDRELYAYEPLKEKQQVTYKDVTYIRDAELDVSDFGGVYVYVMKARDLIAND